MLFTAALAEKLKSKGVQSFALQPGRMKLQSSLFMWKASNYFHLVVLESNLSKHVKPESWSSALTIANETSEGKSLPGLGSVYGSNILYLGKEVKMEQPKTLQEGASTPLVATLDPSIACM